MKDAQEMVHDTFDCYNHAWTIVILATSAFVIGLLFGATCFLLRKTRNRTESLKHKGRRGEADHDYSSHYSKKEGRRQPQPPAWHHELISNIERIEGVIFSALVHKNLFVGIAEDEKAKKDVESRVRKELRGNSPSQFRLIFKIWKPTQLSHEPQCILTGYIPFRTYDETLSGFVTSSRVDYKDLKKRFSGHTVAASIGVLISFSPIHDQSKKDVNDGKKLYLVTVAHLLKMNSHIDKKRINYDTSTGLFECPCHVYFLCSGKNGTEPCHIGCTKEEPRFIAQKGDGEKSHIRGCYTPLPNVESTRKDAVDILLVPISDISQHISISSRLPIAEEKNDHELIEIDFYPFSTITQSKIESQRSQIERHLMKQPVCIYSSKNGTLLSGHMYRPCEDTYVQGRLYYKNVLLYSVRTETGDSGSALFAYLLTPNTDCKRLYVVGFHVGLSLKTETIDGECSQTSESWSVAVRAESNIDAVLPEKDTRTAYIPKTLHAQLMERLA